MPQQLEKHWYNRQYNTWDKIDAAMKGDEILNSKQSDINSYISKTYQWLLRFPLYPAGLQNFQTFNVITTELGKSFQNSCSSVVYCISVTDIYTNIHTNIYKSYTQISKYTNSQEQERLEDSCGSTLPAVLATLERR